VSSEAPAIRALLRAPIHFDAQTGEPGHAPMVLATIGAIHTRLILDIGSDVHLLTRELAEAGGLALTSVEVGTDHAGSNLDSWLVGDNRPIVDAAVEPHPALPVLVNTGGRHTEFEPASVPGLAGGAVERIGAGVSGADVLGASAGNQVLRIGGGRVALPSVMLRAGMVDPAGMLGQDVLRGTVVVVGPDSTTPVLWQVAELGAGRS
jgi:hypothetical protein